MLIGRGLRTGRGSTARQMQRGGEGEGGMEVCWMVVDSLLDFSAVVHANRSGSCFLRPVTHDDDSDGTSDDENETMLM